MEPPVRPLKIKLRQQEQESDPLATKINIRTQEEEAEEDPTNNLLQRQKCTDAEEKGDESGPMKDITLTPHSERPEPRKEAEPIQPVPMKELLVRQEATMSVVQEPVIELPNSPGQQAQQEQELLL